ncbi:MAG TPA: hypothetical protein VHZ07_09530 [Bryobacteraceae bacterium]|jgi:hypothetical protein|nr:hypothetical protein [Bryobacteraceae bacterium]
MRTISEVISEIRFSLSRALSLVHKNETLLTSQLEEHEDQIAKREVEAEIEFFVNQAFRRAVVMAEVRGLKSTRSSIERLYKEAQGQLSSFEDVHGEIYLKWQPRLEEFLDALQIALGEPSSALITREIISILKETQYSITRPIYFGRVPEKEKDVHDRIEAILRCIFPDMKHKPHVGTFLKNFEPDTGLPSIKTLLEYKFVKSDNEARTVLDQLFSDVVGYSSPEWKTLICVIYETKRVFSEKQWNTEVKSRPAFQDSGVAENVQVVVISGDSPRGSKA